MNLYLVSQSVNRDYDTYDAMVVAAPDEETARNTHPMGSDGWKYDGQCGVWARYPWQVEVELIGQTDREAGVILASFNAG